MPMLLLVLSNYTADSSKERQSVQEAIQRLSPPSCFQDNSISLEKIKREDGNSGVVFDSSITVKHLDLAISAAKKKSAPGLDRINNNMLAYLPYKYKELLVNLFNSFLAKEFIPDEWKISLVIFIPKAGDSGS